MITWGDEEGKTRITAECEKRNKHMGKVQARTQHWIPLFDHSKGWHCALRPKSQDKVA